MNATIDEVRAFWDQRPCNIRHSNLPVGTKEYFDEVDRRRYFVEPHIVDFADFVAWRGKRVLEIGCGIGTDMVGFLKEGAHYCGTELSKQSLIIARQRLSVYGYIENINIDSELKKRRAGNTLMERNACRLQEFTNSFDFTKGIVRSQSVFCVQDKCKKYHKTCFCHIQPVWNARVQ